MAGVRLAVADGCCALDDDGLRSISIGSSSIGWLLRSPDIPPPTTVGVAIAMLDCANGPGRVFGLIHGLTARERAPM